ncbi:MAG: hypothetical protein ACRCYS_12645, partial [Beijerinckiaceae bacterium]
FFSGDSFLEMWRHHHMSSFDTNPEYLRCAKIKCHLLADANSAAVHHMPCQNLRIIQPGKIAFAAQAKLTWPVYC